MPLSPTSIWHTISTPEQFLTLQWSLICDTGVDCTTQSELNRLAMLTLLETLKLTKLDKSILETN